MRRHRFALVLALAALLLNSLLTGAPASVAAQEEACFAETGQCIQGRFLDYWQQNGGLARNGFPLTEERRELLEDGNEYTVQYFERVRLEYHPENAGTAYEVLLGQFGRRVLRAREEPSAPLAAAPAAPLPGQIYFPGTGHNLGGDFLAYWETNGGLAQFGLPLTEEFEQEVSAGLAGRARYRVQYFERARFEYHPENPPPYDILLGQFGRRILFENDALAGERGFALLYLTDERVQEQLGPLSARPLSRASGAYQAFERGALLYRGDVRGIYVLCGDERSGRVIPGRRSLLYSEDTWAEGEPVGGGPGPRPGLYEPRYGFGKLWREDQQVRDCLGYAITPDETTYTIAAQGFIRGALLTADTPSGYFIYVVYGGLPEPGGPFYERYPDAAR